ncbi:MAG: DUF2842 domain-containing protein [Pseudomonadota bacterium]
MRKIIAMIILLTGMLIYIVIAGAVGSQITDTNGFVQLIFYIVVGFAWVIPVRPLFKWMNTPPDEQS